MGKLPSVLKRGRNSGERKGPMFPVLDMPSGQAYNVA